MTGDQKINMKKEEKSEHVFLSPMGACVPAPPECERVCVFGTVDLGCSLGLRLLQAGYGVVFGSRSPKAAVLGHAAAAQSAHQIFIAVPREHYDFLVPLANQFKEKVLVDLSNNLRKNQYPEANAEYLQSLVPGAKVVKCFNTLSAWSLQNGPSDANRQVYICGESVEAKQAVMAVATKLGLSALDRGFLLVARELEDFPLQLFPQWRLPLRIAIGLSAAFFFYLLIRYIIYAYVTQGEDISFRIMVSLANQVCPIVFLIMLSLCYMPSVLASFLLGAYRGTMYRRFPNWLDRWMQCRKQLGLLALGFAFLHVLYTLIIPIRYSVMFWVTEHTVSVIRENRTTMFDTTAAWHDDSYLSLGILGFGLYVQLGITSLPHSVTLSARHTCEALIFCPFLLAVGGEIDTTTPFCILLLQCHTTLLPWPPTALKC
uniref:STEAP family member 4 n=1 Tax=Hucho hucho TaxID=62062 RepID=A0A4W5RR12_9TELE